MDLSDGMYTSRLGLISQLKENSEFLEAQREDLVDIWKGRQVFSFYETELTPAVQKVSCTISSRCLVPTTMFDDITTCGLAPKYHLPISELVT